MKITKTQLKQIIKEELDKTLSEAGLGSMLRRGAASLGHEDSKTAIDLASAAMRVGGSISSAVERVAGDPNIRSDEDIPSMQQVLDSIKNLDKIQKDVNTLKQIVRMIEQDPDSESLALPQDVYIIAEEILYAYELLMRHLKTGEGSPYEIWSIFHDKALEAEEFLGAKGPRGQAKARAAYTESRKRRSTKRRRR